MRYPLTALTTLLLGITLSGNAFAACTNGSKTLFHCIAKKNGKQIEVCDAGSTIDYSFGKPGRKPELAFSVPRDEVTTWQWKGIGRYINYSVSIPNNGHIYRVFTSFDKMAPEDEGFSAGVEVEKGGELLATVYCKEDTLKESLEGVDLKEEE